jgi:hypothetical protein
VVRAGWNDRNICGGIACELDQQLAARVSR